MYDCLLLLCLLHHDVWKNANIKRIRGDLEKFGIGRGRSCSQQGSGHINDDFVMVPDSV
jgi:hypothetical protein